MKSLLVLIFSVSVTLAENSTIQEFLNANNQFTSSVYKEMLKSEKRNFLISPFSAETVLAFAHSGCKGDSAQELRNVLHLPNNKNQIESEIKSVLITVKDNSKDKIDSSIKKFFPTIKDNEEYTLHTANKIYIKKDFEIKEEFKNVASQVFNADSENIDFTKNVEAANTINSWVKKQTKNKIKNLINSEDLNKDTRAVLINAPYFKGNWFIQFSPEDTNKEKFYKTKTDTIKVYFMKMFKRFLNYYECPNLKAKFLELPFQGREASMVIVLPNEKDGLPTLENQLESVFVPQHKLEREYLNVFLPKFKIKTSINFRKILESLGVKKIFDVNEADLSGIAGQKRDLIIDKIIQKTFIEVNEKGIEASAPTQIDDPFPYPAFQNEPSKQFIADHPFLFYIKIKDIIIMTGKVTRPKS